MGRGEEIAGRLLRVVAASAAKAANAGRITLYALVTGARAAALAASRVHKGLECQISLLGNEISEIALVDRPLNKSSGGMSERIAVLYKRGEGQMSVTTAVHKYYGTRPSASSAEVNAVWEQMTPQQRVMASIKATLANPAAGERDFFQWRDARANKGGNPRRQGGEFYG